MWVRDVAGKGAEGRIAINRSLGRLLSRDFLANSNIEVDGGGIRPHL